MIFIDNPNNGFGARYRNKSCSTHSKTKGINRHEMIRARTLIHKCQEVDEMNEGSDKKKKG